jgi:hypothetical protein
MLYNVNGLEGVNIESLSKSKNLFLNDNDFLKNLKLIAASKAHANSDRYQHISV